VFCDDGRVVKEKQRDVGWRWERYGGNEWICEIRSTTCQSAFGTPPIAVITHQIGICTCHIGDGKLTPTRHSLQSQFLMIVSPIVPHFCLSCHYLYHHLRTPSEVISLFLSIPWSWVNTEYSIYQSSASSLARLSTGTCQCVISEHVVILNSLYSSNYELTNEYSVGSRRASLPIHHLDDQSPPSTPPILIDHGLAVYLESSAMMASKGISEFTRSWPPSACPNSLDPGLKVHLHIRSITASKCISTLIRSGPPSTSLSSLDLGLQVHLQTRSIRASKYICKEQQRLSRHTGVMEVDWVMGSIYSGDTAAKITLRNVYLIQKLFMGR